MLLAALLVTVQLRPWSGPDDPDMQQPSRDGAATPRHLSEDFFENVSEGGLDPERGDTSPNGGSITTPN
jgi:hypothetical protein